MPKHEKSRRAFRWRDYQTPSGTRPVKDFILGLSDEDAASIVAGMNEVATLGMAAARHLRGAIYEVRADGSRVTYRILFAQETKFILLAISAFVKKTRKAPEAELRKSEVRLAEWREVGKSRRKSP